MKVWGLRVAFALARSYLLGWFAISCYLQLHGLSVLFLYLIRCGLLMWAPVAPAGPRGRAARGGAAPQRAAHRNGVRGW